MGRPGFIPRPRTQENSESEKDAGYGFDLKPVKPDDVKPESRQEISESESDTDRSDSATVKQMTQKKGDQRNQRNQRNRRNQRNQRKAGEARGERRKKGFTTPLLLEKSIYFKS